MADKKGIVIDAKNPSLLEHFENRVPPSPPLPKPNMGAYNQSKNHKKL